MFSFLVTLYNNSIQKAQFSNRVDAIIVNKMNNDYSNCNNNRKGHYVKISSIIMLWLLESLADDVSANKLSFI